MFSECSAYAEHSEFAVCTAFSEFEALSYSYESAEHAEHTENAGNAASSECSTHAEHSEETAFRAISACSGVHQELLGLGEGAELTELSRLSQNFGQSTASSRDTAAA